MYAISSVVTAHIGIAHSLCHFLGSTSMHGVFDLHVVLLAVLQVAIKIIRARFILIDLSQRSRLAVAQYVDEVVALTIRNSSEQSASVMGILVKFRDEGVIRLRRQFPPRKTRVCISSRPPSRSTRFVTAVVSER